LELGRVKSLNELSTSGIAAARATWGAATPTSAAALADFRTLRRDKRRLTLWIGVGSSVMYVPPVGEICPGFEVGDVVPSKRSPASRRGTRRPATSALIAARGAGRAIIRLLRRCCCRCGRARIVGIAGCADWPGP